MNFAYESSLLTTLNGLVACAAFALTKPEDKQAICTKTKTVYEGGRWAYHRSLNTKCHGMVNMMLQFWDVCCYNFLGFLKQVSE